MLAPRFLGDDELERCLNGARTFSFGASEPAVQKIQQAFIDLALLPQGLDTGSFDVPTQASVSAFQAARLMFPSGIVDSVTLSALNNEVADKPPSPFKDRAEWLTWRERSRVPELDAVNFTRRDLFQTLAAFRLPTMHPMSNWVPPLIAARLLEALMALLNPAGSPDGLGTEPASWGTFPSADWYHFHIGFQKPAPLAVPTQSGIQSKVEIIRGLADATGAPRGSQAWTLAHQALLQPAHPQGGDLMTESNRLLNSALALASDAHPLLMLFHTFETLFKPANMAPSDQRRYWQLQIFPPVPGLQRNPWVTPALELANFSEVMTLTFVMNKAAQMIVMPGLMEPCSIAGIPFQLVTAATRTAMPAPPIHP